MRHQQHCDLRRYSQSLEGQQRKGQLIVAIDGIGNERFQSINDHESHVGQFTNSLGNFGRAATLQCAHNRREITQARCGRRNILLVFCAQRRKADIAQQHARLHGERTFGHAITRHLAGHEQAARHASLERDCE